MASIAMMAASIAMGALQTRAQNRALTQQQYAADAAAQRQVDELRRQQERANLVAQEEKSDVAREMDREIGTIIAASADGGQTVMGMAALAGATGAVAGLDKARIESNRQEEQHARRSKGISIIQENDARRSMVAGQIKSNTLGFFASSLSSAATFAAGMPADDTTTAPDPGFTMSDPHWSGLE